MSKFIEDNGIRIPLDLYRKFGVYTLFGDRYRTEEEHVQIIKENNIKNGSSWRRYYKDNNLQKKNYILIPWATFDKSGKQFFEEIYGKKKTEQEHIQLIKENKIAGNKLWFKYWKDNNLKEQGFNSNPWISFDKSCKQFFEEIYGKKIQKTEQEHIDIIVKNNIINSHQWYAYWKDNNLQKQVFTSCPWATFDKSCKQFFEEIYGKKKTEEEHISLMKENNIKTCHPWYAYWKDNNLKKQGYFAYPWSFFKKTAKQFFDEVK